MTKYKKSKSENRQNPTEINSDRPIEADSAAVTVPEIADTAETQPPVEPHSSSDVRSPADSSPAVGIPEVSSPAVGIPAVSTPAVRIPAVRIPAVVRCPLELLGSAPVAVVLILILIVSMAWATRIDSLMGAEVSFYGFYRAWWFVGLLGLLGISTLAVAVRHGIRSVPNYGSVVLHGGLFVLLSGCLISLIAGREAHLQIYDGCRESQAVLDSSSIRVRVFDKDPTAEFNSRIAAYQRYEEPDNAFFTGAKCYRVPISPGPFTWSEYRKLGTFPWSILPRTQGVTGRSELAGTGISIEVMDFRKPVREIASENELTLLIAPESVLNSAILQAAKLEASGKVTAGKGTAGKGTAGKSHIATEVAKLQPNELWQVTVLSASRSVQAGINRQRLGNGIQTVFRQLASPDAAEAFVQLVPSKPVTEDTFLFWHKGKTITARVADFLPPGKTSADLYSIDPQSRPTVDISDSLKVALMTFDPWMGGATFAVLQNQSDGTLQQVSSLSLLSLLPEFNRGDATLGLYGEYYAVENLTAQQQKEAEANVTPQILSMRTKLIGPRLEIASDSAGRYYYRQSRSGQVSSGTMLAESPTLVFAGTDTAMAVMPRQDIPGVRLITMPIEQTQPGSDDAAAVQLKVTVDGQTSRRWVVLSKYSPLMPPPYVFPSAYLLVPGKDRFVMITIERDMLDLGFDVLLERFNQRLDPGTSMPSHYSSDVSAYPKGSNTPIAEHVKIQLNQPVNFVDPTSGKSWRLYQSSFNGPQDRQGEIYKSVRARQFRTTDEEEPMYMSIFTVNYDPGRGLLYLGCFLVCWGIAIMYYFRKRSPGTNPSECNTSGAKSSTAVAVLLAAVLGSILGSILTPASVSGSELASASELASGSESASAEFDFATLQRVPVLMDGRIQPLNTVALSAVKSICGNGSPTLTLNGADLAGSLNGESLAKLKRVFGHQTHRRFSAIELYYGWIVEPEIWEQIPFIECRNVDLRRMLGLPLLDLDGRQLRYVSPGQIVQNNAIAEYQYTISLRAQQEQNAGITHQSTQLEKAVEKLIAALEKYRQITFVPIADENPRQAVTPLVSRFLQQWLMSGSAVARRIAQLDTREKDSVKDLPAGIDSQTEVIRKIFMTDPESRDYASIDRSLKAILAAMDTISTNLERLKLFAQTQNEQTGNEQTGNEFRDFRLVCEGLGSDLRLIRYKLYDEGGMPGVVPSLSAEAIDLRRAGEDHAPVWLNVPTLLYGDASLLDGFTDTALARFRYTWATAAEAYRKGDVRAFTTATAEVQAALTAIARTADSKRTTLVPENRLDREVIARSAYPANIAEYAENEIHYYQLNPFVKSAVLALIAFIAFVASALVRSIFARSEYTSPEYTRPEYIRPLFSRGLYILGVVIMSVSLLLNLWGLVLRGWIMERSPIANMFETVVFVAFIAGTIGLWYAFRNVFRRRLEMGWQIAGNWNPKNWGTGCGKVSTVVLLTIRCFLVAMIFYLLVFVSYGGGQGYSAISLLPRLGIGSSLPTGSDVVVWITSLLMLAVMMIYIPRLFCALLIAPFVGKQIPETVPAEYGSTDCLAKYSANGSVACLAISSVLVSVLTFAACKAPMFNDDLKNLMPILRDNFWLAIHVISIVAGYGSAMLAWILGNAALVVFTVGQYPSDRNSASGCLIGNSHSRPGVPPLCCYLSDLMYDCIKATIFLLAIGIILGGLWADVSWGRFWSWDRKEVWALISMLVYLLFVHAMYWRWFRNHREMTLTLGSVAGALSILMAWYGVNYLLGSKMHGYASGSGGLLPAVFVVLANAALVAIALARYCRRS